MLQGMIMDHALAVKQYSRSSAAQEEPLPRDLRPPHILRMTMDYLLVKIMDRCENKDENLGEWYHFLWDRTRGIRKVRVCVVEALRYKLEGHGIGSRWCHWNFSLT
jgi:hypothetical protein